MIKIINKAQPHRCKCEECYTELEFDFNDIQYSREIDHILSMTITTSYIQCPICKRKIILKQSAKEWD